ncbi:MAG: glycosyltransferase family 87 protein [Anaerolineaceae bacterium]
MPNQKKKIWIILCAVGILAFGLMIFGNYQFAKTSPGGTDFLVHWMGTRNFFLTGTSPYSDDTALKIQTMVYGRAAQAGEHELRVAYPLYSIFFFAPFALIANFTLARAFWMAFLEACLIAIPIVSFKLTSWKPKPWLFGLILLFTVISYNGARPLINGNAVIFITLLIVLSLLAIKEERDEFAGILLAVSTIKPQNVVLLIFFIVLWAIINKRIKIIWYFLGAMIVLIGFSAVLIPDWILQNLREVLRYPSYNPPGTVGAVMISWWGSIGNRLSIGLTVILTTILGFEWWRGRKAVNRYFIWLALLTVAVSQWIGIQTDPGNFILLYPGIFFALEMISGRWKEKSALFISLLIAFITIGIWALFLITLIKSYQPIQNSLLFFPIPIIAFILLYWVRWWVINAKKVDYENRIIEI